MKFNADNIDRIIEFTEEFLKQLKELRNKNKHQLKLGKNVPDMSNTLEISVEDTIKAEDIVR